MAAKYVRQYIRLASITMSAMASTTICSHTLRLNTYGSVSNSAAVSVTHHNSQSLMGRKVVVRHQSMSNQRSDSNEVRAITPKRDFHIVPVKRLLIFVNILLFVV